MIGSLNRHIKLHPRIPAADDEQRPTLLFSDALDTMAAFTERLAKHNAANKLYKSSLLNTVCLIAGLSIFFFGYDQGLMGGVNTARDYAERMGFGHWDDEQNIVVVDKPLLQGGIVAVYYLPGTLFGCLLGGWLGDRYGRIKTIAIACVWCIFGAALQSAAMNANWMFCGASEFRFPTPHQTLRNMG